MVGAVPAGTGVNCTHWLPAIVLKFTTGTRPRLFVVAATPPITWFEIRLPCERNPPRRIGSVPFHPIAPRSIENSTPVVTVLGLVVYAASTPVPPPVNEMPPTL